MKWHSHFLKKSIFSALWLLLLWIFISLVIHYPIDKDITLPSPESPIELYSNQTGDNLSALFTEAIESAKASITLSIYSLTDAKMIKTLQKATDNSIAVTIICDAKASPHVSQYLPKATLIKRFTKGLMHQKILIIDTKTIYLSSANFTYNSLHIHSNLVIGIENEHIAQLLEIRASSMTEEGGYTPLPFTETAINDQHIELWVLPENKEAVARIKNLFKSAKKSIQVAMFTFTRIDFAEELIEASLRGIRVNVILDRYSGSGASAKVAKLLDKKNVAVNLSTGNKLLHTKCALIDENILVTGSANWTKAAFQENDDYFIVLYPLTPKEREKMKELFERMTAESKPLELIEKEKKKKKR